MNEVYIGTMANAYRARDIVRNAGYAAYVSRMAGAADGCGYRLITDMDTEQVTALLHSRGVNMRRQPQ